MRAIQTSSECPPIQDGWPKHLLFKLGSSMSRPQLAFISVRPTSHHCWRPCIKAKRSFLEPRWWANCTRETSAQDRFVTHTSVFRRQYQAAAFLVGTDLGSPPRNLVENQILFMLPFFPILVAKKGWPTRIWLRIKFLKFHSCFFARHLEHMILF